MWSNSPWRRTCCPWRGSRRASSGATTSVAGGFSFGGSSVAENTIYINGLNVTDFYNRIGFSAVPYTFYKEFQVKTGGYSVEFGRTTGGVINAVTRSGTNEFEFGSEITWEPDSLQAQKTQPTVAISRRDTTSTTAPTTTSAPAGPIIQDKLFFFALYEFRDYNPVNTDDSGIRFDDAQEDDDFWGAKIDWEINDRNHLELLAFSDGNQTVTDSYSFDASTGERGDVREPALRAEGRRQLGHHLHRPISPTRCPRRPCTARTSAILAVQPERHRLQPDPRSAWRLGDRRGLHLDAQHHQRARQRETARLDFEWSLGSHQLRFGLDREIQCLDSQPVLSRRRSAAV